MSLRFERLPIWKRFTQGMHRRSGVVPLEKLEPFLPRPALLEPFFAPSHVNTPLLSDFKIERLLGSGGMGVVQLARSCITGKPYALKTIHAQRLELQRPFMDELQTWIDLPPHPHIVACYFFRTLGDRLGIFAEYVQGEPLSQWIAKHADVTVDQIVDMAVQSARALQALHDRQCVHQDVKPANMLMRRDGWIKLTDFGLARARQKARVVDNEHTKTPANPLVSRNGMTLAYSSPEQRAGEPLTLHTDMFSWAVSVLEMAVGGVRWLVGEAAIHTLEEYLDEPETFPGRPILPPDLVELLRKCLARNPADRYASMQEVHEVLLAMTRSRGHTPPPTYTIASHGPIVARNGTERFSFGLAVPILQETLEASMLANTLTPTVRGALEKLMVQSGLRGRSSPRAEAITELIGMSICLEHYPRNGALPWKRLNLLFIKGLFHEYLDDPMGALALYREALELSIRAVIEGDYVTANHVAEACFRIGGVLAAMQEDGDASDWISDALRIRRHLIAAGLEEYAEDLGDTLLQSANMTGVIGVKRPRLALFEYDQALDAYAMAWAQLDDPSARKPLCPQEYSRILVQTVAMLDASGDVDVPDHLHRIGNARKVFSDVTMARRRLCLKRAAALAARARTLALLDRLDEAETNCQDAHSLCAEVPFLPWDTQRMATMAEALLAQAFVLRTRGDAHAAADACQRAIDGLSVPALATDLHASPGLLVQAYLDLSTARQLGGDIASASQAASRAVEIAERLVVLEGRQRFAAKLAQAYAAQAVVACDAGHPEQTLELVEKVHVMLEQVVRTHGSLQRPLHLRTWVNIVEPLFAAQRRARALIGLSDNRTESGVSPSGEARPEDVAKESQAQSIPPLPADGSVQRAPARAMHPSRQADRGAASSPAIEIGTMSSASVVDRLRAFVQQMDQQEKEAEKRARETLGIECDVSEDPMALDPEQCKRCRTRLRRPFQCDDCDAVQWSRLSNLLAVTVVVEVAVGALYYFTTTKFWHATAILGAILWCGGSCFEVAHGFHRFSNCGEREADDEPEMPCFQCKSPEELDVAHQIYCHRCGAIDTISQWCRVFFLGMLIVWLAAGRAWIESPRYKLIFQIGVGIYGGAVLLVVLGVQILGSIVRIAVQQQRMRK